MSNINPQIQSSYWLLRAWLKDHAPKTEPMRNDFIVQRTKDHLARLEIILREEFAAQIAITLALDPNDDIMPVADWLEGVKYGGFIDYDGFGNLATATVKTQISISPSDITVLNVKIPDWCTHIVWYNR